MICDFPDCHNESNWCVTYSYKINHRFDIYLDPDKGMATLTQANSICDDHSWINRDIAVRDENPLIKRGVVEIAVEVNL